MKLLTLVMLFPTLVVITVATPLPSVYSQENIPKSDIPKFFAIQHAQSGSLSEINETAYYLELNDVSDKTILFSDRPDRIVVSETTADFIENWSVGQDSYSIDAPNSVLIVDEIEGNQQDVLIVELFNPVYDVDNKALKYEAIPDNTTSIDLTDEFGPTTLVIDNNNHRSDPP